MIRHHLSMFRKYMSNSKVLTLNPACLIFSSKTQKWARCQKCGSMKILLASISLLLIDRARPWMSSPVAVPHALHEPAEHFEIQSARGLLQSTPQANVCPETEYYCGPGDAFEKEVHDALNQPKGCIYDNGIALHSPSYSSFINPIIRFSGLYRYMHMQTLHCGFAALSSSQTALTSCTRSITRPARQPVLTVQRD